MNHLLNIIARMLTAASLLAISTLAIASPQALATLQVPATVVGDDNAEQLHDEISPAQEQAMWSAIRHNVGLMQKQGVLIAPNIAQTVTYNFPLRMAAGLPDTAGFRVSAFVDHNPAIGSVLDYNGGSRTYDGHRGTDYALWPHNWNKVDAGAVEVIAAAAGTIAYKSDTDATDHHPCDAGSVNDQWNYVALVHADGRLSMYGHLRHNSLTSKGLGQTVAQGEYLGTVASSGNSSGPHMHFEMRSGNFTNEEWIDPYAGPHSQPGSMWASQRPYIDSAINKLSTHSAQPVDTPCQPTVTNVQDNFSTPAKIRFYAYYRDYQGTLPTQGTIYRPDGSVFQSWSTTDGTTFTSGTNRSWVFDFSASDPAGTWRFEAIYNGQTYETYFNVNAPAVITVISPGNKKQWSPRQTHSIMWSDNLGGNVNIALYRNGAFNSTLVSNTASDGLFSWKPDAALALGSGYTIRVTSVSNPAVYDVSDAIFALRASTAEPAIMLLLD